MKKKSNWFWNSMIVLTIILCIAVFVLHYQNWITLNNEEFRVISGIYSQNIAIKDVNGIEFVQKLPEMKRKNGFSWLAREKGVFLDSVAGQKAYVFVDDLRQQKIMIRHQDSLVLYFNLADSIETLRCFDGLRSLSSAAEQ